MGVWILLGLIAAAIPILLWVVIIRAVCNYLARKNAEEFDYDYLAERMAEEICKKMMIIQKQKELAVQDMSNYNGCTQDEECKEN